MKFRLAPKSKLEYSLDITGEVGLQGIAWVMVQFRFASHLLTSPKYTSNTRSCDMRDAGWIRPIAYGAGILFLVSWVFPVGAGVARDISAFPKWWGRVDVALAFVLAIVAFGIQTQVRRVDRQGEDATYRVYRFAIHGIIVVAVLVMLAGDRIRWANCATGFLWRAWLGLYILPWWLLAVRSRKIGQS